MPFSITSKFSVPGGAEHLVTLRATNAQDFKVRLQEADAIFPTAGFLTWLDRAPDVEAAMVVPPDVEQEPVPNPVRATEAQATANANTRAAAASAARKGNGNGDRRESCDLPNGQTPFDPRCPAHFHAANSRFGPPGTLYCPQLLDDGTHCKWTWKPAPAPANVN
jgi:hypothetical protein